MFSFPLTDCTNNNNTHRHIAAAIADHLSEVQALRSPKTNRDQPSDPTLPSKSDDRGTWDFVIAVHDLSHGGGPMKQ